MALRVTAAAAFPSISRDDRKPGTFERVLFVGFMLVAVGLTHVFGSQEADSGNPIAELLWLVAYVLAAVSIYRERATSFPLIRRSLPLLLILGLAIVSTAWSFDPLLTLRRAFGLAGTTTIAIYIVCRYPLRSFLETFIAAVNTAAVISIALIAAVPSIGVRMDDLGSWNGLFLQKNHLGATMELGIVTMLVMLPGSVGNRRRFLVGSLCLSLVLLIGSRSMTSFVGLLVVASIFLLLSRGSRDLTSLAKRAAVVFGCLAVAIGAAYLLEFTVNDVLSLIGRDTTFSGRDEVWEIALKYIADKPLLGYGYQVFWETSGPAAAGFTADLGWNPTEAHNGFLAVALDLGLSGVFLLVVFLALGFVRSTQAFQANRDFVMSWPFFVLLAMTINNLAEHTFVLYNEVLWLAVMVAFLYATADQMYRSSLETRPNRHARIFHQGRRAAT